jgi:hypothetical protein
MSDTRHAFSEISEDDARDLIAMFDRARTPEQFRAAMQVAKMRERSHRAAAARANRRNRGLLGMVAAIPRQLRAQ